jgi:hypothetical protein
MEPEVFGTIKERNVQMNSKIISAAIVALESEQEQIASTIKSLKSLLPSEPKVKAASTVGTNGGRAPRGMLRDLMKKAIGAKTMSASQVRDAVTSDYPYSTPRSLYTAIFNLANKDPLFKKTKDGISLAKKKAK